MKDSMKDSNGKVYFTIEYLPELGCLYSNWISDFLPDQQLRDAAMMALDKIALYKVSKCLNDNRELQGAWEGSNEWIATYWVPKAIELGLKRFAHIASPDIWASLSAEFMQDNTKTVVGDFQMQIFGTREEAEKWLKSS